MTRIVILLSLIVFSYAQAQEAKKFENTPFLISRNIESIELLRWVSWTEEQKQKIYTFAEDKQKLEYTISSEELSDKVKVYIESLLTDGQKKEFLEMKNNLEITILELKKSVSEFEEKTIKLNAAPVEQVFFRNLNLGHHFNSAEIWALIRTPLTDVEKKSIVKLVSTLVQIENDFNLSTSKKGLELKENINIFDNNLKKEFGGMALKNEIKRFSKSSQVIYADLVNHYQMQNKALIQTYITYCQKSCQDNPLLLRKILAEENFIDDQRVESLRNQKNEKNKNLSEYFKNETLQVVAKSGLAGIHRMNRMLENEINENGSLAVKNNLIAGLAFSYFKNPEISYANYTSLLFRKIIIKKEPDLNINFVIQALSYLPNSKNELLSIIKSTEMDAETSLIALDALPKSANGNISVDNLLISLEKNNPEFLKKILPLVSKNLEEFKLQNNAVKVLLKICDNPDENISKNAVELLRMCIENRIHYELLENSALTGTPKIKEIALKLLLAVSPQNAAPSLTKILVGSGDKTVKLIILERLGNPSCEMFYPAILSTFNSPDPEIIVAGLKAIGSLKNSPDKGLKEVIDSLKNENKAVKMAGIIAIGGFEYRKPFYYTNKPDQLPFYTLINFMDSQDEDLKGEVVKCFEKISGVKQNTTSDWKNWFTKEKFVLDLLIEMESKLNSVTSIFKKGQFKEAKSAFKEVDAIYNKIISNHINQWKDFDKYMKKKGDDFMLIRITLNKSSPNDD